MQIAPAPTEPTDIVEVEPPEPRGGAWLMRANSFVEDVVDLLIGVGIICGLLLLGLSAVFPEIRPILIALAKHLSDNWKVLLILLYPMFRSSWRRVEPYIHELLWLKFGGGKEPTKPGAQVSPRKDG